MLLELASLAGACFIYRAWRGRRAPHVLADNLATPVALRLGTPRRVRRRVEMTLRRVRSTHRSGFRSSWCWLEGSDDNGRSLRIRLDRVQQLEDLERGIVVDGPGDALLWISVRLRGDSVRNALHQPAWLNSLKRQSGFQAPG